MYEDEEFDQDGDERDNSPSEQNNSYIIQKFRSANDIESSASSSNFNQLLESGELSSK